MWRVCLCLCLLASGKVLSQEQGLVFIKNENQWNEEIDFLARTGGVNVFVSARGFGIHLFDLAKAHEIHSISPNDFSESGELLRESIQNHFFKINFLGANLDSKPEGVQKSSSYYNYFIGSDSCRWATNVSGYTEIIYPEIYSGIDLRIASLGTNLKYDFIVKIGADPSQIKIEYCGLDGLEQANGDLMLKTSLGNLTEKKPLSYQSDIGNRKIVSSEFELTNEMASVIFPDGYDPCKELIVDPLLIFSTYSGSTADNWGSSATPGEHGTLYSSGVVNHHYGGALPTTTGAFQTTYGGNYDISILKYDSIGSHLLYATYLGGSSNETPHSLLMDESSHDLIILGTTSSANFPVTTRGFDRVFNGGPLIETRVIPFENGSDIIVARLKSAGNQLVASTYIGGNFNDGLNVPNGLLVANYGDEMRGDVTTDASGNIFISTVTSSPDFPVTSGFDNQYNGGASDGVVMKLRPDLSGIIWSGFLGGSLLDAAYSIKLDKANNVIVAGGTTSGNFPTTPGAYQTTSRGNVDGWIARIASAGHTILNSTFTGTIRYDQVYFIDINQAGEIYCYGQTNGAMPVTAGVYKNANSGQFLQKFDPQLSALKISTVFGSGAGMPNISPTAFLVNECDNIFMSGWGGDTNSFSGHWGSSTQGMPVSADAFQKTTSGSDFYFIVLNADATAMKYATFLGGTNSKTHVDGGTSRFDKYGIVYHAVCSGCAAYNETNRSTSDFPTTPGAWSRTNNSLNCNNAAYKFDLASLRARLATNSIKFDNPNLGQVCFPDSIVFQNLSIGGETFMWDFDDGTIITGSRAHTDSVIHQFKEEGTYRVKLKAIDFNTCTGQDSVFKVIRYFKNEIEVLADTDICEGDEITLTTSGGGTFSWKNSDNTFQSSSPSPRVKPAQSTIYYVDITDLDGCLKKDTVNISVVPGMDLKWDVQFQSDCISRPSVAVRNLTEQESDVNYWFDFGDGQTSDDQETVHSFDRDSTYILKLRGQREFCVYEVSRSLPVYTIFTPNVITPNASPGKNDNLIIGLGSTGQTTLDVGIPVSLSVVDRWGKLVFESNDYKNDWNAGDQEGGVYYITLRLGDLNSCKSWIHVVK
jgi:hypothetical protein